MDDGSGPAFGIRPGFTVTDFTFAKAATARLTVLVATECAPSLVNAMVHCNAHDNAHCNAHCNAHD